MADTPGQVRVRFAPSPTGYLHIGGARTALFNAIYARQNQGVFVLRIEDTDRERSTPEAVQAILDGLRYLGLDWDEGPKVGGDHGPYFQSERIELHKRLVEQLLGAGKSYRCFCPKERLAELRKEQMEGKQRVHYDRRCRELDPAEAAARGEAGEPWVVRFAVEPGETVVEDLIRGRVTFQNIEIEDFIIQRADGTPVYNLAVVGDDAGMRITHVVRGEDHLSNTPKQILLFAALGFDVPMYAHVALIHGPGKQKLSKRHGAVSVTEYEDGYLPEAMVNFLVRMGWSYDDKEEIFSMDDLIEKFSLRGISKSPAVYDVKKLEHLNNHYIRERSVGDLVDLAVPRLVAAGLIDASSVDAERSRLEKIVAMEQPRLDSLTQIVDRLRFYFEPVGEYEPKAVKLLLKDPDIATRLRDFGVILESSFDAARPESMEEQARQFGEAQQVSMKSLCQPMRAILTGRSFSPPLFEVIAALGKDETVQRLKSTPEVVANLESPKNSG